MRMPRFTAGASLYRSGHYRTGAGRMPGNSGTDQRVTPQGDGCPRGRWCCQAANGSKVCIKCSDRVPLTGHCLNSHSDTCEDAGLQPTDGC